MDIIQLIFLGLISREAYEYINARIGWPTLTDQLSEEQLHLMKSHYYAVNTLVDDWIGRIVEVLKEQKRSTKLYSPKSSIF